MVDKAPSPSSRRAWIEIFTCPGLCVMEMQLEIRAEDSYDTIDSLKVTLNFSAGSAV